MITLYDYELSGNCYKVRLLLHMLGLAYERREIEFFPGRQHKTPEFLAINPLGQLPVLDDGGYQIRDAQAILTYLAARYAPESAWYPTGDAQRLGEVAQWLAFAAELTPTASAARMHQLFGYACDLQQAQNGAYRLYQILDEHLWFSERRAGQAGAGAGWICRGSAPTVADVACFPYVMLAPEGGLSLVDFPALRRWTDRFKRIPGFTVMAGVYPTAPALA